MSGATLNIFPAAHDVKTGEKNNSTDMGSFTAWDPATGTIAWNISEPFSLWGGLVATAGDVVIYGTLEGYLKVRDANTGAELYRFKTPSGIIGNVSTWEYKGKQYGRRSVWPWRLGWRGRSGRSGRGHRRFGRCRRIQEPEGPLQAGWFLHGVCTAEII